ncbi:hypothetical protein GNI_087470, partial [Gregarina niphandrodes]
MLVKASDIKAVPVGRYVCLAALEQRAIVERVSPSLFISFLRSLPGSSKIVLDCRAREHVANGAYLPLVHRFGGVVMADRIPPHQRCDEATRGRVKDWIFTTCNLKHVFVMDTYTCKQSLQGNNMLTRVVKYLGLSGAKPVRVCILDCGLHVLQVQKYPIALLNSEAPIAVALAAKPGTCDGLYVFHQEYLKVHGLLGRTVRELDVRYVLNLTRAPAQLKGVKELGNHLPFKDAKQCAAFYGEALAYLVQIPAGQNVLVIDTHTNKISSELLVMLLILGANYTYEDAVNITRQRLTCPELDSAARAAFMLMAESQGSIETRLAAGVEQFNARFDSEYQLKSTQQLTAVEKWNIIAKLLEGKPLASYQPVM